MSHSLPVRWRILLDENEWDREEPVALPEEENASASVHPKAHWSRLYTIAILCLLILAVGFRLWQQAEAGLAAVDRSLNQSVSLETQAIDTGDAWLAQALFDPQADARWRRQKVREIQQPSTNKEVETEIVGFEVQGALAMVQVRITDIRDGRIYRENRFYRETADGWLRTQPDAVLWGDAHTLESEYFVFHFRRRDGAAVAEAASVLDAVYVHMHTALGLPLSVAPTAEAKVQVHVAAGSEQAGAPLYRTGSPLWVNSPLLLRLPEQVADDRVLAELVALSLRRALVNRAISPLARDYQPTPEFLEGVRLWLAWEEGTLLTDYRQGLIDWLFGNATDSPQIPVTPYLHVCALFGDWQIVSLAVPMLLSCADPPATLMLQIRPPTALRQVPMTIDWEAQQYNNTAIESLSGAPLLYVRGQPIAIATILEYASHTYGRASVAALLRAAQAGESWRAAIPPIFGLSQASFEAGWWAWLADEYGVDMTGFLAREAFGLTHLLGPPRMAQGFSLHVTGRQALAEYQARLP